MSSAERPQRGASLSDLPEPRQAVRFDNQEKDDQRPNTISSRLDVTELGRPV